MDQGNRGDRSLFEALRQRLHVLGIAAPAWVFVALGASAIAGIVWILPARTPATSSQSMSLHSASRRSSARLTSSATTCPSTPYAAPLIERARRGELRALKQVERSPQDRRPIEQTIALAEGHSQLKRSDLHTLMNDVIAEPSLLDDVNTIRALHAYVFDPEVAIQALEGVSRLEHAIGPDLLFEVWVSNSHAASAMLAGDLLHHINVRKRATAALEVALALMDSNDCPTKSKLLPLAIEHADRRAKKSLKQLQKRDGCGQKKDKDCYPCLRSAEAERQLTEAVEKASSRPPPRPWTSHRVQKHL